MCALGGVKVDPVTTHADPTMWFRLSSCTRAINGQWQEPAGPTWIVSSLMFFGKLDLADYDYVPSFTRQVF